MKEDLERGLHEIITGLRQAQYFAHQLPACEARSRVLDNINVGFNGVYRIGGIKTKEDREKFEQRYQIGN